jgi:NAD-dependent SIR2 family protein deacetylase
VSTAIDNLAALIRTKRDNGARFIVMLGAGASVDAGVPPMSQLMEQVLEKYDQGGQGSDYDRFDRFWGRVDKNTRDSILKEYLDKHPSKGHESLARLVREGYFDTVVTFNYDDLLEQTLDKLGVDYRRCVRGELQDTVFADYMLDSEHGPRVLKIHGSLKGAKTYLATWREMRDYPEKIADAFADVTNRDLIVCGYSFSDVCVTRGFTKKKDGGQIFCANPEGASQDLKKLALNRLANEQTVDGPEGRFDEFFPALEEALSKKPGVQTDVEIPDHNPYKFLEGLYGDDRDVLIGRDSSVEKVLEKIDSGSCRFLNVYGERKSGKSSFARAGVMPALRKQDYEVIYLRCLPSHSEELVGMLTSHPSLKVPITGLADAIGALEPEQRERFVIVLDQFERVVKSYSFEHGEDGFIDLYDKLYAASKVIAGLIMTSRDERTPAYVVNTPTYVIKLIERHGDTELAGGLVELKELKGDQVADLLATLNGLAGDCVPEDLRKKYAERISNEDEFTLAHAHALCHLFVSDLMRDRTLPKDVDKRDVEGKLNLAINACDVMNLIDDLSLKEERILLRNLMKIVSDDSRERIAKHVRDSLYQLLTKPGYSASAVDRVIH